MKIMAIDPGGHVGVAFYNTEFDEFRASEHTPEAFTANVAGWIHWADTIVVEGFYISGPRAKEANQTIEMIGAIKFLATRYGKTVVEQRPADATSFSTKDKMVRLGWWTKGSDHARSATRHLILYLARGGLLHLPPEGGTE